MKHLLLIPMTAVALSGCAGALPWNDQENAGLTDLHVYYDYDEVNQILYPTEIRVTDGKEAGTFSFKVKMSDDTEIEFTGTDIKAFEGQRIRADVEKVVAEQLGDVADGVVDAFVDAIMGIPIPLGDDG